MVTKSKSKIFVFILLIMLCISCLGISATKNANATQNIQTPTLTIKTNNVSYSDSLYILYAVTNSGFDRDKNEIKMLFWTEVQEEYTISTAKYIETTKGNVTLGGESCLVFYSQGLAARQMTDDIFSCAYVDVNGEEYYSEVKKFSILEYASALLDRNKDDDLNNNLTQTQTEFFEKLLDYGGAAQKLLNYKTDNLASDVHYNVTVVNGTLADGFNSGRYKSGKSITLQASTPEEGARFTHWQDENGDIVGVDMQISVEVPEKDTVYSAVYAYDGYLDDYNGTYGYESFANTEKGSAKQNLYKAIDAEVRNFHINTDVNADENNLYATVNYSSLGLTFEDALAVWATYRNDNPLYYWMSNTISYNESALLLYTAEEYADGNVRENYNNLVYDKVEEFASLSDGDDNAYQTALLYHDSIINAVEYSYDGNGNPSNEVWAHNVIGAFENGAGVCETYARTFQLLLNYAGVENVFVTGTTNTGESHAWNLVKLDDGNWYWCDLTFDDHGDTIIYPNDEFLTVNYHYFCVNDTENVNWRDYGTTSTSRTFSYNHVANTDTSENGYYLYDLPARSSVMYNPENEIVLREKFTIDGVSYAPLSYNEVQLVATDTTLTDVIVPETVEYQGTTYTVVSVGEMRNSANNQKLTFIVSGNGIYNQGNITLPKTLEMVFGLGPYLTNIFVDEENPYFTSVDGVLFTKSLFTLIKYPDNNERTEYIIPDETYYVDSNAIFPRYLEKITIGKNVRFIGYLNFGAGHYNETPSNVIIDITHRFDYVFSSLIGEQKVTIHPENPNFEQDEYAVYNEDKTALYFVNGGVTSYTMPNTVTEIRRNSSDEFGYAFSANALQEIIVEDGHPNYISYDGVIYTKDLKEFYVPKNKKSVELIDGITEIEHGAFRDYTRLESIIIPNSVTSISDSAFLNCTALASIEIPNSVTYIGSSAFSSCTALTSIEIANSVTTIGTGAFYNCSSLTSIVIPDSVTYFGNYVFSGCERLENATIGNGITSISELTFARCKSLTSVIIPNSVTSIMYGAFENCTSLTSITIPNSVTSIGELAFYGCSSLSSIVIPESVTTIDRFAFSWCTSLKNIYCEVDSKPSGWHDSWSDGSNSGVTVIWGYKPQE